jgi:N-methylhydantoinase A
VYARLERQAVEALRREGFSEHQMLLVRSADLRYFGQAWEVRVDVPAGKLDRDAADVAVAGFHSAHERAYGYSYRGRPEQHIEWVNLRVTGIGPITRPELKMMARTLAGGVERARTGERLAYFDQDWVSAAVYARDRLQPGDCLRGPAIVEEFGSTTVVLPSLTASVDDFGNLLLRRA